MRREASTTSTSPTSTPARSASSVTAARVRPGRQVLVAVEQGSTTTGASHTNTTSIATTAPAPAIHQPRGNRLIRALNRAAPSRHAPPPTAVRPSRGPTSTRPSPAWTGRRRRRARGPTRRTAGRQLDREQHARADERARARARPRPAAPPGRSRRRGGRATSRASSAPSATSRAEPDQALQVAEVARPVELGGAEVGRLGHRQRVDHAVRAQQPHRRLGHHHGRDDRRPATSAGKPHVMKIGAGRGTPPRPVGSGEERHGEAVEVDDRLRRAGGRGLASRRRPAPSRPRTVEFTASYSQAGPPTSSAAASACGPGSRSRTRGSGPLHAHATRALRFPKGAVVNGATSRGASREAAAREGRAGVPRGSKLGSGTAAAVHPRRRPTVTPR